MTTKPNIKVFSSKTGPIYVLLANGLAKLIDMFGIKKPISVCNVPLPLSLPVKIINRNPTVKRHPCTDLGTVHANPP